MEIIYERLGNVSLMFVDGMVYFLISMIGAFVKDLYDTLIGRSESINIKKVFVGTILSTFILFGVRSYITTDATVAIAFLLGVIGWELFSRISTIEGLKSTIIEIRDLITGIIPHKKE